MSIYRRRLMIANALKKSDSNINYPNLIAAWSAAGKSNDDEDRATLKDLTGKGHDITLNGFAFNTEGSGYGHPLYPDALVFDGVDDYGINEDMPMQTDYTIIVKRKVIKYNATKQCGVITKRPSSAQLGAFWFERGGDTWSYGTQTNIEAINNDITWQNKTSYNGTPIASGSSSDTNVIHIGRNYTGGSYFTSMAFYSAYLFDRSLDEQEIKSFIRKYIDADYLLPSEQTTE